MRRTGHKALHHLRTLSFTLQGSAGPAFVDVVLCEQMSLCLFLGPEERALEPFVLMMIRVRYW